MRKLLSLLSRPIKLRGGKAFSQEFTSAFGALGQACRERGVVGGVSALPWIMVLGSSGAGKSTALERSGLRFTSHEHRQQDSGRPRNCTWRLTSDAVFIDTTGRYAGSAADREEWQALLHLLRRQRRRPIDAVLLQVAIDELVERPHAEVERAALQLRERLDELVSRLEAQVPVHLLFNKCDLLDGFVEFFGSLDDAEQAQPWGFNLDTSTPTPQRLGERFAERFAELVRCLSERSTRRLLALSESEAREAALGFPAELTALGTPLKLFTETLFEPRARGEQPWLCSVYLGSAEQTDRHLPALRQRRAAELCLTSAARSRASVVTEPVGRSGETFFLRGVFAQVLRQAERSARPTAARQQRLRLHQRLAVGLAMAACLCGSLYLGGRYGGAVRWMYQLQDRTKQLHDGAGLPRLAPRAANDELLAEIARQDAVRVLLDQAPTGLPSGPAGVASALLLQRIEEQWLLPLQPELQRDLEHAAHRQGSDPGEDFSRGFAMLRLSYVLQGKVCAGTDPELTRQSLAQYILEHWQRVLGDRGRFLARTGDSDEDPEHPRTPSLQLRRLIELYFAQEPQALAQTSRLRFDDALRAETRRALLDGSDDAAVVFNLRASLSNLYARSGQLGTPLFADPGVEQVFTARGCGQFFSREASRGSEWWMCVLDRPLPKDPPDLEDIYRQKYAEAWNRWLHELALRPISSTQELGGHAVPESLSDVLGAIDALIRERPALTQVLAVVGRGQKEPPSGLGARRGKSAWSTGCGRGLDKSIDWGQRAYQDAKAAPECTTAIDIVSPLTQLISKDKPPEEESEPGGGREEYQRYLTAAKTLRATLNRVDQSVDRYAEALKLVQATLGTTGDLWALHTAREELIAVLHGRLAGTGIDIKESGLNRALRELEGHAWRALLPLASRALNEQWKNQLVAGWQTLRGNQQRQLVADEDRCKQRMDFLRKDLGDFVSRSLVAFYSGNSLGQCTLKRMAPPFDQQLLLLDSACQKVRDARKVGEEITDCPKALGASGGVPKRDPQRADVPAPAVQGCNFAADEVLLDRGDKVFVCPQSTGVCAEGKDRKTSQRGRLLVKWQSQYGYSAIFERDSADELFQLAHGYGNKLAFPVPKGIAPGKCEGFEIRFILAPAGSGAMPKGPDSRWKTVDLPASLL